MIAPPLPQVVPAERGRHGAPAAAPASRRLGERGRDFLFAREAQPGVSDRPHWPGGASGVTLGPGYDMRDRSPQAVRADLVGAGLEPRIAERLAAGAGLAGEAARQFAERNRALCRMTPGQERALMAIAVAPFERAVQEAVRVPLNENEFAALVSFAYNIGAPRFRASTLLRLLNGGDRAAAAAEFGRWVRSGPDVVPGLARRRRLEAELFLAPAPPVRA